ncbi:DMT family transporter [Neptunomonas sp. XY-337]|uniref:DMT family transporter n=1 Tax=Neptunomonas sp. XY-337 TaxID=2561897 RepID=UPI0010A9D1B0|nr:DMT family transporter [Neptunomonas sp. XY-337]
MNELKGQASLGIAAGMLTICIWASWLLSMRYGQQSSLSTYELAILRYGCAALVLWPVLIRHLPNYLCVKKRYLLGICCGAGLPFFFLSSQGMAYGLAADAGLLITGTFPIFVGIIAAVFYREPLNHSKVVGLAAIAAGVVVLVVRSLWAGHQESLIGYGFFLGASVCWALFTISLRVSGLSPWAGAALLCCVSTVVLLMLFPFTDAVLFASANFADLSHQMFVQFLCVGIVTGFSYAYAVRSLGAEATSAIGALTPVLVAIGGYWLLGESLTPTMLVGLVLISLGVFVASGVLRALHVRLISSPA